jgi:hypothetical protein
MVSGDGTHAPLVNNWLQILNGVPEMDCHGFSRAVRMEVPILVEGMSDLDIPCNV